MQPSYAKGMKMQEKKPSIRLFEKSVYPAANKYGKAMPHPPAMDLWRGMCHIKI